VRNAKRIGMVSSDVVGMMSELDMLIYLTPNQLEGLEEMCRATNSKMPKPYIPFEFGEWLIGLGINYLSTVIPGGVHEMFCCVTLPGDVLPPPAFGLQYGVSQRGFQQWRKFFALTMPTGDDDTDPWKSCREF
jgi:hypothetical protein